MSVETKPRDALVAPNGRDDLAVRERWLKSRRRSREVADRGLVAVWVLVGTLGTWLFIAAFAGMGH